MPLSSKNGKTSVEKEFLCFFLLTPLIVSFCSIDIRNYLYELKTNDDYVTSDTHILLFH